MHLYRRARRPPSRRKEAVIPDSGPYEDVISAHGGHMARQWLNGEVIAAVWDPHEERAKDDACAASGHACWNMAEREAETQRAFAEQEAQRFARLVRRQGGPL